jgi:hypothetical protein
VRYVILQRGESIISGGSIAVDMRGSWMYGTIVEVEWHKQVQMISGMIFSEKNLMLNNPVEVWRGSKGLRLRYSNLNWL